MIGANIKKLRLEHGMTQKNLADKLFVSAQAVSRWENNEVEPSISTILELAKIFEVSSDEILGLENTEEQKKQSYEESEKEPQKSEEEPPQNQSVPRQFLAVCEICNSPIYESSEIVRIDGNVHCSKCHAEKEERERIRTLESAHRRRKLSFIFGPLASVITFIIIFSIWDRLGTTYAKSAGIFLAITMFTFISCVILNNNFVGEVFLDIATWSIRAPGLIFTLDIDGIMWFIAMKILFAIIGVLIGIAVFFLALFIACLLSVFVYPYAIITNIKHPENSEF